MKQQHVTRKELLARKHEAALIRRIVLVLLLSVLAVGAVIYYAIPAMVKIADIWDTTKNSGNAVVTDTTQGIPLVRPRFEDDQNRATNSAELALRGTAPAGINVHLVMNGQEKPSVVADSSGNFVFTDIRLQEGSNTIVAYSQDERGRKSNNTEDLRIDLDTRAPKVDVSSPTDGQTFSGNRANIIQLKGQTDEATQMYVNGAWIILKSDGSFEHTYQLQQGENILTLYAMDDAGNKSVEVVRKVTWNQ